MNIIKFKDIVVTDSSLPDVDWYNDNLRGKYAYWIRCHVVVPLEAITPNMYVSFETTINNLFGYDYYVLINDYYSYSYKLLSLADTTPNQRQYAVLVEEVPADPTESSPAIIKIDNSTIKYADLWEGDYNWMTSYVDFTETDDVNSIEVYKRSNSFVPDGDITLEELKNFRSWLAENLLVFKGDLTDNQTHTLSYYANGMTDDIVKWMTVFGQMTIGTKITDFTTSACGCGTDISSLYNGRINACDTVNIYKTNLHKSMVEMFSDIDFWNDLNKGFLKEIVKYIEGIIKAKLSFTNDILTDAFSCKCLNNSNSAQEAAQLLLTDTIEAFNYIINNEATGHKLMITQTLLKWSDTLYEKMQWD